MGNRAVVTFANMADVEPYLVKDSVDDGRGLKVMKWYDWLLGVIGTVAWFALASYIHSL